MLLVLLPLFSCAQYTPEATIKNQVEIFTSAFFSDNYKESIKYTHPQLLVRSGGEDFHIKRLKENKEMMFVNGMTIENFKVLDGIIIDQFSSNEYHALVPTSMEMTLDGQKLLVKDYLFGFSDASQKQWVFCQGEQIYGSGAMPALIKDFKTNIKIPTKPEPIPID